MNCFERPSQKMKANKGTVAQAEAGVRCLLVLAKLGDVRRRASDALVTAGLVRCGRRAARGCSARRTRASCSDA